MKTFNRTIIIGRLRQSPKVKSTAKGDVAEFMLYNSTISNGVEQIQWHRIAAFGKQATLCAEHLHKGDLCCIEGRLDTHTYEKDGEIRYSQIIIAERITSLSSKRKGE